MEVTSYFCGLCFPCFYHESEIRPSAFLENGPRQRPLFFVFFFHHQSPSNKRCHDHGHATYFTHQYLFISHDVGVYQAKEKLLSCCILGNVGSSVFGAWPILESRKSGYIGLWCSRLSPNFMEV